MQLEDLRRRARIMGIETRRLKKTELIRAIQEKEGNTPCFGTIKGTARCDELSCSFRLDCLGKRGNA